MRAACGMRGERMEVQCCISRCIPGFAARVSVGEKEEGGGFLREPLTHQMLAQRGPPWPRQSS